MNQSQDRQPRRGADREFHEGVRALTAAQDDKLVRVIKLRQVDWLLRTISDPRRQLLFEALLERSPTVETTGYCEYLDRLLQWSWPKDDARAIMVQTIDARIAASSDPGIVEQLNRTRRSFSSTAWRDCR